jgi:hypothetical protein
MACIRNHPLAGLCYVLSEAFYHLYGRKFGLKPVRARYYGRTHWWLIAPDGKVIDLTADQFSRPYPYHRGRAGGFLTRRPCARTRAVLKLIAR